MNNSYFNPNLANGGLSGNVSNPGGGMSPTNITDNFNTSSYAPDLPIEQSYVENILRMNKGKVASFYMTFPDSNEWRDRVFTGVVEQAARDHFVISDPKTGKWYLLLSIYLDYIVFDEEINYKVI